MVATSQQIYFQTENEEVAATFAAMELVGRTMGPEFGSGSERPMAAPQRAAQVAAIFPTIYKAIREAQKANR